MSNIIVVTGSRWWRDISTIEQAMVEVAEEQPLPVFRHGCASGADAIARSIAIYYAWDVEDWWPLYKRRTFAQANKERNIRMLEAQPLPRLVMAFPTKESRGTWHCVNEAKKRDISVRIYEETN